ncbi:MAG: Fic family protein [Eubacteriales bacterium]|nr:Fic family protein [Eubacteriales bacterium]
MWDTIQKLEYRAKANIADANTQLEARLCDRLELPLAGIHGEKLFLTGMAGLRKRAAELDAIYSQLPAVRGMKDVILLDAYSSATIEGARTTVQRVQQSFNNPKTKDDRMVINTVKGSNYAYKEPISEKNIRRLWEKVVDGVCENEYFIGEKYRDGMVVIGSMGKTIHTPAAPEQLPGLMAQLFAFRDMSADDLLLSAFAAHFYFVYVHPFCDGNGRTARILNASQLYHGGYRKMKNLPLSSAINNQLSGYYSSLADSEITLPGKTGCWLDLSPFVSFMLDAFERCMMDAALSLNAPTEAEAKLLERMNKVGLGAEITSKKAATILDLSDSAARNVLNSLVKKGYLTLDNSQVPFLYRLSQHIPE